jgi:hypothetical protein
MSIRAVSVNYLALAIAVSFATPAIANTHGLGSAVAGRPMIFRLRSVLREAEK